MQRKRLLRNVALFLFGVLLAYLAGCYLSARTYISPIRFATPPPPPFLTETTIPNQTPTPYQIPVWATHRLADTIATQPPTPTETGEKTLKNNTVFLLVHGYGGSRAEWVPLAELLQNQGEVLIPATQGQTESPVPTVGFGKGEAQEITAIAQHLKKSNPELRIIVVGVSMGGAAAWIAAGQNPDLFHAVATEGAFARLDWASNDFLSTKIPAGAVIFQPIIWFASAQSGISPAEVRPDIAAQRFQAKAAQGRALLIHGEADEMFPLRHAKTLAQATGAPLWIVPQARHAQVQSIALPEYAARLTQLVQN